MNPNILRVVGPGFLNQVPTLNQVEAFRESESPCTSRRPASRAWAQSGRPRTGLGERQKRRLRAFGLGFW